MFWSTSTSLEALCGSAATGSCHSWRPSPSQSHSSTMAAAAINPWLQPYYSGKKTKPCMSPEYIKRIQQTHQCICLVYQFKVLFRHPPTQTLVAKSNEQQLGHAIETWMQNQDTLHSTKWKHISPYICLSLNAVTQPHRDCMCTMKKSPWTYVILRFPCKKRDRTRK